MPARKRKNAFGDVFRSKVTYHRDVAGERRILQREAMEDRRRQMQLKKIRAQELAAEAKIRAAERKIAAAEQKIEVATKKASTGASRSSGGISESELERIKAHMESEISKQEDVKRAALAKVGNPSWGYGIYQGRGFETRQLAHFRSKAAAETYARSADLKGYSIKRAFAKDQNPRTSTGGTKVGNPCGQTSRGSSKDSSPEYRLGYNLGQTDRQTAHLPKTWKELEATFDSMFVDGTRASALPFFEGYKTGYGQGQPAAPNGRRLNPEPAEGDGSEEYKQAKRIAELFHGRPVKEELTIEDKLVSPDWYAEIGPLAELRIKAFRGYPFRTAKFRFITKGDALIHLLTSPDGRQMYLRGGDQEINLDSMGMGPESEWFRDMMSIGEVTYFAYLDGKKFHGFKITEYTHKVGSALDWSGTRHIQKTNAKPVMIYDSLSKTISFAGGQGKVETDDLVEGMSPGIVA
jgi:hypothetical protein